MNLLSRLWFVLRALFNVYLNPGYFRRNEARYKETLAMLETPERTTSQMYGPMWVASQACARLLQVTYDDKPRREYITHPGYITDVNEAMEVYRKIRTRKE